MLDVNVRGVLHGIAAGLPLMRGDPACWRLDHE